MPNPSITSWTRLEPRSRDDSMKTGLEARVRDPLWGIMRQWQMGELAGEDAGSPVSARVQATASRLTRVAIGSGPARALDVAAQPMEPLVEAEAPPLDVRLAAEAGAQLLRFLRTQGADAMRVPFVLAYPFPQPTAAERATIDPADLAFFDAVASRVPDATKLHAALAALGRAGDGSLAHLPPAPAVPAALVDPVRRAGGAWLDWY